MRRLLTLALVMTVALAVPAMAQFPGGLPGREHLAAARAYAQSERVVLTGDVVHYWFDVPVGSGPFDTIRIHRVVKETSPGRPLRNMEGILLLPGSPQFFESIFLQTAADGVPAEEGSIPVFLAVNGVDVWGMDYGWSFIPYPTSDLSFLRGWGFDKDTAHIGMALSIVRWLRATSGQGAGPVHVLGFSYGAMLAYPVAAEDTQRPGNLKNVKGIVPVDGGIKDNSPAGKASACASLPGIVANLETIFATGSTTGIDLARAALDHPDALSPQGLPAVGGSFPFPPVPPNTMTNYQYALARSVNRLTLGGTYAASPPYAELFYTAPSRYFQLAANQPVYLPYQHNYDNAASRCESPDYPVVFDDHLGEVTVPIFTISRRQSPATDAATRTASTDITALLVNPDFTPALYGHADFFLANDAAETIWRPVLDWILAHR